MADRLYERTAEISAIDSAVSALGSGRGSSLLLEARAGRGKSTLVEYAVEAGRAAGARTMLVRARHLTSAAPFEVLRRLLGPAVEELGGADRLTGASRFARPLFTPGAELSHGVDYGCQWLVAWLAEQSPLVLAVDDAHWADSASLRVLLDVQAELSEQPVMLMLASRPVENPSVQSLLAAMATHPDCTTLTPNALSRDAVEALVADELGPSLDHTFVDECLRVSGGNAFYLRELMRQYEGVEAGTKPAMPAPGSLSLRRTVAARLGELGTEATRLAQSAAILGDGCSLNVAADLAGLDSAVAVRQAARLEAASILRHGDPVEFYHPLIRRAVEAGLPEVAIGELHARAARLLWTGDEPAGSVAEHLVVSPGAGDPGVSAFLAEQSDKALDAGSVATAVRLLRRALDEPPPPDQRHQILVALGRAEHAHGELEEAREHLETVLGTADGAIRLSAAAELFDVLVEENRYEEIGPVHRQVIEMEPYGDSEAEVRLRAQLLVNAFMGLEPDLAPLPVELSEIDATQLPTARDVDRYLRAIAAIYERTMQRGTTSRLMENLRRVIATLPDDPGDFTDWDVRTALAAVTFYSDDSLEEIEKVMDRVAPAVARLRGATPAYQAELDHRRVVTTMARGEFEDALARIDVAEEFVSRHHLTITFEGAHRFARGWVAFERGEYEAAAGFFSDRIGGDNVYPALGALLAGRPEHAVELLATYDLSTDTGAAVKQIEVELEPHLIASHAFGMLGNRDRAEVEARREVEIRRTYGSTPRLALALRRQAGFATARASLPLLEEAVALAEDTPRRPVLARVLASYGASLRRSGRAGEARSVLYRVIDDAEQMGMGRVRARAQQELVLAGGRPRRTRLHGPTALTDAQRQVAELAASACTNREIAEQLFVSIKTVETHLAAAYRKLGISRREELAPVVGQGARGRAVPMLARKP